MDAESLAEMTGLALPLATNLLTAAGGNLDLAIELHFDGAFSVAAFQQEQETAGEHGGGHTVSEASQRFSVLTLDSEDAENGESEEGIFLLNDSEACGAGSSSAVSSAKSSSKSCRSHRRNGSSAEKSERQVHGRRNQPRGKLARCQRPLRQTNRKRQLVRQPRNT